MFLAILVKLAAQYFFCLNFTLKLFLKFCRRLGKYCQAKFTIVLKYNNRLFISGSYDMSNSYSNFDIS